MPLSAQRKASLHKYLQSVYRRQVGGAVAVFDIGTKAARVLVGPRTVPAGEWRQGDFFNDAVVANLGRDLRPGVNLAVADNAALTLVCDFVTDYVEALGFEGVAAESMHAVGTAVFRWIANRDEVLRAFTARTKLRLTVLPPEEESRLSLAAIAATYKFGLPPDTAPFDALVLLDQGGGSLELSFTTPEGARRGFASLDRLGTVFLRDRFMAAGEALDDRLARLRAEIAERMAAWPGFPELAGKRLLAYGMGTAVAACLPRMHNYFMHNFALRRDVMASRHGEIVAAVRSKRGGGEIAEADREPDEADNDLTVLYGVPVFLAVMDRLGIGELRYAGYGLRYGAYLSLYREGAPLASL